MNAELISSEPNCEWNYSKKNLKVLSIFIKYDFIFNLRDFWCVYYRNMYDELAQNENASQYEDVLKKGIANISIKVDEISFLSRLNYEFFSLFMNQKDCLKIWFLEKVLNNSLHQYTMYWIQGANIFIYEKIVKKIRIFNRSV